MCTGRPRTWAGWWATPTSSTAPLFYGATTIVFEGKPVGTPDPGAFWRVISDHGVKVLFTAPTAFRAIKREDSQGEFYKKYDHGPL
jgi:propionyl-CoA synthetase